MAPKDPKAGDSVGQTCLPLVASGKREAAWSKHEFTIHDDHVIIVIIIVISVIVVIIITIIKIVHSRCCVWAMTGSARPTIDWIPHCEDQCHHQILGHS